MLKEKNDRKDERKREMSRHAFPTYMVSDYVSSLIEQKRERKKNGKRKRRKEKNSSHPVARFFLRDGWRRERYMPFFMPYMSSRSLRLRFALRAMPLAIHYERLVTHYATNKVASSQQRNVSLTVPRERERQRGGGGRERREKGTSSVVHATYIIFIIFLR